jgi:hypothetical protein
MTTAKTTAGGEMADAIGVYGIIMTTADLTG